MGDRQDVRVCRASQVAYSSLTVELKAIFRHSVSPSGPDSSAVAMNVPRRSAMTGDRPAPILQRTDSDRLVAVGVVNASTAEMCRRGAVLPLSKLINVHESGCGADSQDQVSFVRQRAVRPTDASGAENLPDYQLQSKSLSVGSRGR